MLALARPIIGAFLQHGEFSEHAAITTGRALAGFSIGLVGFSVYLFVLRGFYAHQDTRTPFVINVVENLLNIVFAVLLVGRYGVLGLGLAFALAYLLSAAWALQVLSFKVPGYALRPIFASLGRMLLASVLMAEVVWLVSRVRRCQQRRRRRGPGADRLRGRRRGLRRRAGAPPVTRARGGEAVGRP